MLDIEGVIMRKLTKRRHLDKEKKTLQLTLFKQPTLIKGHSNRKVRTVRPAAFRQLKMTNRHTNTVKLIHDSDLCSQENISLGGWNGALREAMVNVFVLFPIATGRFMIREAKQDDCGLNAGINSESYTAKRFSEDMPTLKM